MTDPESAEHAAAVRELIDALDDDQVCALRYLAFELQDDVKTTEEQRNAQFRDALVNALLVVIGAA